MLRLQPHSLASHQQGGCLSVLYLSSPEISFVPLCLNAVRRTLLCFATQLKLLAIRSYKISPPWDRCIHQKVYPWSQLLGSKDNYFALVTRLSRLFFKVKKRAMCYVVRLKSLGPILVVAGHLLLPSTLDILNPNKYLISLCSNSCINLCLIFSYYSMSLNSLLPTYQANHKVNLVITTNTSKSCCECSFYAFRFGQPRDQTASEISLIELLSRGAYVSFGWLLISFIKLFYGFQDISKVVL